MLRTPGFRRSAAACSSLLLAAIGLLVSISTAAPAQTESTGNISGTITGPKGASVSGAEITITKKVTGEATHSVSSPAGTYVVHDLRPGDYLVHVEAKGFRPAEILVRIQAATTASGDVRMQRVEKPSALLNRENTAVQGTVTATQLEQTPSNRNFLDLANLEPGVQVLDGRALAPSKSGVAAISVNGFSGRTIRMLGDGVDISDEVVGATAQNLPASAIQELQIGRSNLGASSGPSAAGAVNAVTKSGANDLHGQAFGAFRNKNVGVARFPGGEDNSYQRQLFGGDLGGALRQDKLFFFLAGEYSKRNLFAPVLFNYPFDALSGGYNSPFHQTELDGRLDYKFSSGRFFYRFAYDSSNDVTSFGGSSFQLFKSRNNAPTHTLGLDFNRGDFLHSLRFAYNRFSNGVSDAVSGANILNPPVTPAISLNFTGGSGFGSGPNPSAPQRTIQSNKEFRYDGTKPWRAHTLRFGFAFSKIDALVFADLYGSAPQVGADTGAASSLIAAAQPGGLLQPLNYPVDSITLGNGFGCFSEKSAFSSSCGGFSDTRLQFYWGDTWKVRSNLTASYGLSYVRDTGRTDSDLPSIPCSTALPCTGNLLNQFGFVPEIGNRVRQPSKNFAPQFGLTWAPGGSTRTVFRGGIGLYYDNSEFQNVLFDRVARLPNGQFNFQPPDPCASHGVVIFPGNVPVNTVDGLDIQSQICGQPLGATINSVPVATAIADLQSQYQAASAALGSGSPNPGYVGTLLSNQRGLLGPNFQTPRSVHMNLGFQRQIGDNTVLSVDYVRSVGTHSLLGWDTNHVGDAGAFDTNCQPSPSVNCEAALNAINNTLAANLLSAGCPTATSAGASSQAAVNCYTTLVSSASIVDFARHGLDSSAQYLGGLPASLLGLTPQTGAAFPGINPLVGRNIMFFPAGRSVYSGLQIAVRSRIDRSFRSVHGMDFQLSYAYSKFSSNVPLGYSGDAIGDQNFLPLAMDFNRPTRFFGPASQDRKHQFSFATTLALPFTTRLSLIGRFASPLPQTLFLPASGGVPGEIFRTDTTGDGAFGSQSQTGNSSYGDMLPGTNVGSFGRSVKAAKLNTTIQTYNSNFAGRLTPAGEALAIANLFTVSQLSALGAVTPLLQSAPPGNVGLGWLHDVDLRLSWPIKIKDRVTVEPGVSMFNVFNYANFDAPDNRLSGILGGQPGQLNGTTTQGIFLNGVQTGRTANRIGLGSGVFQLGAPRQLEFGLKISF